MENFKDLQGLFNWMIYSGGAILVASWALERITAFQAQLPEVKKTISMVVSAVLAVMAYAVITYVPPNVFEAINPWFQVVLGTVILYGGSQVVHRLTK
jgi:hypothetical protein